MRNKREKSNTNLLSCLCIFYLKIGGLDPIGRRTGEGGFLGILSLLNPSLLTGPEGEIELLGFAILPATTVAAFFLLPLAWPV